MRTRLWSAAEQQGAAQEWSTLGSSGAHGGRRRRRGRARRDERALLRSRGQDRGAFVFSPGGQDLSSFRRATQTSPLFQAGKRGWLSPHEGVP